MIMGTGNLTELTDVDSAGVNTVLLGFCQELSIHSVLTTAVINWARSSVRELDLARRLVHHAVVNHTRCPSTSSPGWSCCAIRGSRNSAPTTWPSSSGESATPTGASSPREERFIAINNAQLLSDPDPFVLFEQMGVTDAAHAFYLGYEMMKAKTALTLSKNYRQDRAMDWGFLTEPEAESPAAAKRASAGESRVSAGKQTPAVDGQSTKAGEEPCVILEGIVTTLNHDAHSTLPRWARRSTPARRPDAIRASPVSIVDDLPESEGARRGRLPRHRRRAAAGPDGHRRWLRRPLRMTRPADVVAGRILLDACRYYEFRVVELDDREDRTTIVAETVAQGRLRDFFGFNRAKHAVVEAAILATRTACCRSTRCSPTFASSRFWSTRLADPESGQPSRCCTGMFTRRPLRARS